MPRPKGQHPNTANRYARIRADYASETTKTTPKGRPLHNHAAVVELLAAKWGLSEERIGVILKMDE